MQDLKVEKDIEIEVLGMKDHEVEIPSGLLCS